MKSVCLLFIFRSGNVQLEGLRIVEKCDLRGHFLAFLEVSFARSLKILVTLGHLSFLR
jgi:hypothetical protein